MKVLLFIFLGGGLGSVFRYLVSLHAGKLWKLGDFPSGTFVINILGCFFIGLFTAFFSKFDNQIKYFFIAGFCGGFTTFSTFSLENYHLWQSGNYSILFLYVFLSFLLSIGAVFTGFYVFRWMI